MKIKTLFALAVFSLFISMVVCGQTPPSAAASVKIIDNADNYSMSNGIITAVISKKSGSITSLKYEGKEVLAGRGERPTALWSHDATSPEMVRKVTIDPAVNNGQRGEISIKGISGGRPMGNGPGGSFIADIEIRYALGKGETGIYTYCVFDHLAEYPATSMGEARFVAFLDQGFDWISADKKRNYHYPLEKGGLDLSKYTLTANQTENPAFGWINTKENIGFWLINPSMEYMSGGPTKVDFLCHRDTKIDGVPCALNYWRSSHYGGSIVDVAAGEKWTKLIGPFMIYLNKGTSTEIVRNDALTHAVSEKEKWPYNWVNHPEYPLEKDRATVSGRIVLKDPITAPVFTRIRVGLAAPDYPVTQAGVTRIVDWQYDTKFYQFWVEGNARGEFSIPNIRPGKYTLHAIADGVLGEYAKTDILVEAGQKLNLGDLEWKQLRYGKQIWDIGIANRNASEFKNGDRWFENQVFKDYPKSFPNDVNYTIGKSDYRKDWYFMQLPHVENPDAPENNTLPEASKQALIKALGISALPEAGQQQSLKAISDLGLSGKYAKGRSTAWNVNFNLTSGNLSGKAILRIAICGTSTREISVMLNGKPAGLVQNLRIDGAPSKSGFTGMWYERTLSFDANLLKEENNVLTLTVPAGAADAAIMYDYIRLEHQE